MYVILYKTARISKRYLYILLFCFYLIVGSMITLSYFYLQNGNNVVSKIYSNGKILDETSHTAIEEIASGIWDVPVSSYFPIETDTTIDNTIATRMSSADAEQQSRRIWGGLK